MTSSETRWTARRSGRRGTADEGMMGDVLLSDGGEVARSLAVFDGDGNDTLDTEGDTLVSGVGDNSAGGLNSGGGVGGVLFIEPDRSGPGLKAAKVSTVEFRNEWMTGDTPSGVSWSMTPVIWRMGSSFARPKM
jgi:hypothetical protein